ncbi:MAG: DUF4160 domain-containing protein [Gemmatimonadaceae bacterium]|nr:DUF4160 domain-containing protein [Gemmatimonadaceae bacterium]
MPALLEEDGFKVMILLPPREHGPPHVHVRRAGGVVVIERPDGLRRIFVRKVFRMRNVDVLAAVRLVERNSTLLLTHWRAHHG